MRREFVWLKKSGQGGPERLWHAVSFNRLGTECGLSITDLMTDPHKGVHGLFVKVEKVVYAESVKPFCNGCKRRMLYTPPTKRKFLIG